MYGKLDYRNFLTLCFLRGKAMRLAPLTQFNGGMLMRFHVWILTLIMLFGSAGICVSELSKANGAAGVDSGRSSVYTEYGAWKYTGQPG